MKNPETHMDQVNSESSVSQYFDRFYTSEAALKRRFTQCARHMAFRAESKEEAVAWQRRARARLRRHLGLHLFEACTPEPRCVETVHQDGLTRETWHIRTEPDVWMPFYLFVPDDSVGPMPLVICPHGHGSGGKWATGGRRDIAAMRPIIERYNYDYGVQIARAGFITACPDARGFGERREPNHQSDRKRPEELSASSCHDLTLAGAPLGLSVQGMWTWDLIRLLDHLSSDRRIAPRRIGCAGLSGGGLQTLNFAALDRRVQAAVVSGYFYGVRESLQVKNGNCMCNMVPHLWEDFDMGDIGALIAPRRLFIETGDSDSLNGQSRLANVNSQVETTRRAYTILDARTQLHHHVFEGGHRWNGSRSLPWLQETL